MAECYWNNDNTTRMFGQNDTDYVRVWERVRIESVGDWEGGGVGGGGGRELAKEIAEGTLLLVSKIGSCAPLVAWLFKAASAASYKACMPLSTPLSLDINTTIGLLS